MTSGVAPVLDARFCVTDQYPAGTTGSAGRSTVIH